MTDLSKHTLALQASKARCDRRIKAAKRDYNREIDKEIERWLKEDCKFDDVRRKP
jgi:tmRNA-binding protein